MLRERERANHAAIKMLVVVNQDPEFLRLFRRVVEAEAYRALESSYQVVVSPGDDGAYALIREALPDLVVLDLLPGDASSWQLLDRLTRDPRTAAIPVLACSAPTLEVQARQAELRGQGRDLLLKPFSVDELLERVRQLAG